MDTHGNMGFMTRLARGSRERAEENARHAQRTANALAEMRQNRMEAARRAAESRADERERRADEVATTMAAHRERRAAQSAAQREQFASDRRGRQAFMAEFRRSMWGGWPGDGGDPAPRQSTRKKSEKARAETKKAPRRASRARK